MHTTHAGNQTTYKNFICHFNVDGCDTLYRQGTLLQVPNAAEKDIFDIRLLVSSFSILFSGSMFKS